MVLRRQSVGDLVMRSVYLPAELDAKLRQLAHESGYTKSDLIRAAASLKVKEWGEANGPEKLETDVTAGLREASAQRQIGKVKPRSVGTGPDVKAVAVPKKPTVRSAPTQGAAKPAPKRRSQATAAEGASVPGERTG